MKDFKTYSRATLASLNTMCVGQRYTNRVTVSFLFIKDLNKGPTKEYCFYT